MQPTLLCLGHALRKLGEWKAAEAAYNRALGLVPRSAATLTALAFTAQLRGDNSAAVELYHVALGLRPDDRCVADELHTSCMQCLLKSGPPPTRQLCARNAHGCAHGGVRGQRMTMREQRRHCVSCWHPCPEHCLLVGGQNRNDEAITLLAGRSATWARTRWPWVAVERAGSAALRRVMGHVADA